MIRWRSSAESSTRRAASSPRSENGFASRDREVTRGKRSRTPCTSLVSLRGSDSETLTDEIRQSHGADMMDALGGYRIRRVANETELDEVFEVAGAQFTPQIGRSDRRLSDLRERLHEDRALMLVLEEGRKIVGAALGFRKGDSVTLRIIGLEASSRGRGLGRRLMEAIEIEAIVLGARSISLGADASAKGFYGSLGYHGKLSRHKDLPLPGRVRDLRADRLKVLLGDLEGGAMVAMDAEQRVPSLL